MIYAKNAYYYKNVIHLYYAARTGSVINSLDSNFFKKFLMLELYQVDVLKKHDLFDEYIKKRFSYFLKNWYLNKLTLVKTENEKSKSEKIIKKISALYNSADNIKEDKI